MTPEQIVHKSIATFLDLAIIPPDWWTTFPSGGGGKVRGALLKALGLKTGIGDILLIRSTTGRAFWLEVKPGKKKAEDYQKAAHVRLALANSPTAVVHDIVETHDALVQWGFPLKANIWGGGIPGSEAGASMKEAAE
jgi:hypothetical protein